jgi:iron uptake system component EfeO
MMLMSRLQRAALGLAGLCLATVGAASVAQAKVPPAALISAVSDYKLYVADEVDVLVRDTRRLAEAIKAGDLAGAQSLYAPARLPYERIEPIAELFSDLDKSIDARAGDFAKKEADPGFGGFHRIEYGLFAKKSTDGLQPVADRLVADIVDLQGRIKGLTVPPEKMVGGAAALIEEVAKTKISGEEDRYSRSDLWDFAANVAGSKRIYELLKPVVEGENPRLTKRIDANFAKVEAILARYATADGGYESYDRLSKKDRTALRGPITALAEDLSKLRGTLGLN